MPKISVITPTVRPEGLELVKKALKRQTFKAFEWIVVSPFAVNFESCNFECTWISEPMKQEDDVWTLNKAYNAAIKEARGDLIVSWQDFTYAKPDTLERFWNHYEQEPNVFVGAVGNKYSDEDFLVQVWQDPRETDKNGTYYPCYFSDIEANLCAVPKAAFYDVGGFDQSLDQFFGMDFYSVAARASIKGGWDFKLDQSIKSYSLVHGRPERWEELNAIHGPYQKRAEEYIDNPVLTYLK